MKRGGRRGVAAGRSLRCLVAALGLIAPGAGSAQAECAGSEALDRCVVGGWRSSGDGAAEWMKRNMPPGIVVPQGAGGTIVFDADGTYRAVFSSSGRTGAGMQGGGAQAQGRMAGGTSGRWSVSDGRLNMCADAQEVDARIEFTAPDGTQRAMALPAPVATGPMSQAYRCAGDQLETQMTFPGIADPMTTRYSRIDPEAVPDEP